MTSSLFPDHLVFVRPDQRETRPVTRGQVREMAYAADGIWVGIATSRHATSPARGTTMPTTTLSCI